MSSRVVVIVLNWNGRRYLKRCLRSVLGQTYRDLEVVLVDNGSTDGSLALLNEHFPQVRVIANSENRGFAAANNQAIESTDSEYVVTLNNDTKAYPTWLEELVRTASTDERLGACASRMLFAHQPDVINSAGIALDRAGIAWEWRSGERDDPTEREPTEVFGACAGAALYRRAMLDEIGQFDEDFFAYLEDVDLAWRAQWAGWRTLSVPTARVLHFHSGTAIEGSSFKNRLLGRNKVWLIVKNYPWPHLLRYLPVILSYDVGLLPYVMLWRGDWGPLLGRLEGLTRLARALRKRRRASVYHQRPAGEVLASMAPVATPRELWRRYQTLRERLGPTLPHPPSRG
jgi:GT2 family glycosyltransferase